MAPSSASFPSTSLSMAKAICASFLLVPQGKIAFPSMSLTPFLTPSFQHQLQNLVLLTIFSFSLEMCSSFSHTQNFLLRLYFPLYLPLELSSLLVQTSLMNSLPLLLLITCPSPSTHFHLAPIHTTSLKLFYIICDLYFAEFHRLKLLTIFLYQWTSLIFHTLGDSPSGSSLVPWFPWYCIHLIIPAP